MKRRAFITALGGMATAWPVVAQAQQRERMRRIGAMLPGSGESDAQASRWTSALRQGLQEFGWNEGRNLHIDYRWPAGDLGRMGTIAKELVALQPDVIFAGNTPSTTALLGETRTIPIVFANLSDPVGSGLVASLAHPGGNATGFAAFEYSLGSKWLEMLKEIAPATKRSAVLFNPDAAPYAQYYVRSFEAAAPAFSVHLTAAPIRTVRDVEDAMAAQSSVPGGSLIVLPDNFTFTNRAPVISLAARFRLPAIYAFRIQALDGGLISYGPDTADLYRRAASYIDRILRGANPADMPVQQPTKYEMVINLKTAKALGLEVPSFFQQRADEVIE